MISRADAIHNVQRVAFLLEALRTSNFELLREALKDRLHQPYRVSIVPGLKEALELRHPSLLGVCLSGAGPSVVAFAQQNLDEISALLGEIYTRKSIPFHVQTLKVHPADSLAQSALPARSWCVETAGSWKI
jgi:homoserine kinase